MTAAPKPTTETAWTTIRAGELSRPTHRRVGADNLLSFTAWDFPQGNESQYHQVQDNQGQGYQGQGIQGQGSQSSGFQDVESRHPSLWRDQCLQDSHGGYHGDYPVKTKQQKKEEMKRIIKEQGGIIEEGGGKNGKDKDRKTGKKGKRSKH